VRSGQTIEELRRVNAAGNCTREEFRLILAQQVAETLCRLGGDQAEPGGGSERKKRTISADAFDPSSVGAGSARVSI
jgi:hypothetical protein